MTPSPRDLAQWINSAHVANRKGDYEKAARWCRKALHVAGDIPEAWYNLSIALRGLGRRAEAVDAADRARRLSLASAEAQNTVGLHLLSLGALPKARECFERAIDLAPAHPFAYSNLGKLFEKLRSYDEAERCLRKAIELHPALAPLHVNLGGILNALNRHEAAEAACRRAIQLDAKSAQAWSNLGVSLMGSRGFEAAEAACRRAIELDPRSPEAWSNLGSSLLEQFRLDEAAAACRRAIELDPGSALPHDVMARILVQRSDFAAAVREFDEALRKDPYDLTVLSNRIFSLSYVPGVSPAEMLAAARQFDDSAHRGVEPFRSWGCTPDRDRTLRIGLVSGDLRRHPVGYLLKGPLAHLGKSDFHLFAYSSQPDGDDLTAELRQHFSTWAEVAGTSDRELAQRIHDDRIDILIDLAGHTRHSRLPAFAWKPAPVQVTWLGYFATTGLAEIDWKIGDPWVSPAEEQHHFTERIWRLPDSCFCFAPPHDAPEVADLPSETNGYLTFGCFNNLAKVNDDVVAAWSRILAGSPEARLLLKTKQLASAELRAALLARFERCGIAPERLLLEGPVSYAEYLASYARVDIALDPFPYPGGATTAEGLWMGVPALTLRGDRFIAHQGESLLHAAGLADWIARDRDEYVRMAVDFAADRARLARLRAGLREQVAASPLFHAPRHARHLEAAWRRMWQQWCDQNPSPIPTPPP
jgi:predicted O-linked N-acetylglucosamine transferase (SPINDLY family)